MPFASISEMFIKLKKETKERKYHMKRDFHYEKQTSQGIYQPQ